MLRRHTTLGLAAATLALALGCSQSPQSPVSPSAAAGSAAANADGSTLKVSAPNVVSPVNNDVQSSRRPTFTFQHSAGKFQTVAVAYRLEILDKDGNLVTAKSANPDAGGQTVYSLDVDLAYNTEHVWRVRAESDGQFGPWSGTGAFKTPVAPAGGGVVIVDGNVGPQRSIAFPEAFGIITGIHDTLRINLGSASTRDFRVAFLNAAVAAIYFGHPRFNPKGPDPSWCVKDAGGGRPQSDDALVLCRTREAWDLIVSSGGDGYRFEATYLGALPGSQNVYPPPQSALSFLNR